MSKKRMASYWTAGSPNTPNRRSPGSTERQVRSSGVTALFSTILFFAD